MLEDRHGWLWVSTVGEGLDRQTGLFEHYRHRSQDSNSLSGNIVTSLVEDRSGELWIGIANGGGVNRLDRRSGHFHHYREDTNFRPVDLEFAPDGSLCLADWHNVLIGSMQHNARDPLRDYVPERLFGYRSRMPICKLMDRVKGWIAFQPGEEERFRGKKEMVYRQ